MAARRISRSLSIVLFSVGLAILGGIAIGWFGSLAVVALAGLFFALAVLWWPELGFLAALASMVLGQLIRIQLPNSDNTVIINDILLPAVELAWLLRRLASRHWRVPKSNLYLPTAVLVVVMAVSLFFNTDGYTTTEWLSGALYFVRWLEYAAVFWLALDMVRTPPRAWRYVQLLVWTGVALAVLGFLQLKFFPDFSFMVPKGWDPHVGRLLSTWFDPNFLAGYFALLISITLAIALSLPWRAARWWWVATGIMLTAVILTFSRSGYLALAAGIGIVTVVRSRVMLIALLATFLVLIIFVPRINERVIGIRTVDQTAQFRIVSWQNAATVISDHPVIGVGYNLYKFVQVRYGFLTTTSEHSASGSDSSILTIAVTTGLLGVGTFLWLYGAMIREAWRTWRDRRLSRAWQGFGLGLMAGLVALFVHGQFVNSLVYPHVMQAVWIFVAVAVMTRNGHAPS